MEVDNKRLKTDTKVAWLNLHLWIPIKDVRKIIYKHFNKYDRMMIKMAHTHFNYSLCHDEFYEHCAMHGYIKLYYYWAVNNSHHDFMYDEYLSSYALAYNIQDINIPYTWLKNKEGNIQFRHHICTMAAGYGDMKVLQWAHKHGCPWSVWTCEWAAAKGHLKILKSLREQHCPWDKWICYRAKENNQQHILKWIHENNSPCRCIKK